jgi:hypothetical protein
LIDIHPRATLLSEARNLSKGRKEAVRISNRAPQFDCGPILAILRGDFNAK